MVDSKVKLNVVNEALSHTDKFAKLMENMLRVNELDSALFIRHLIGLRNELMKSRNNLNYQIQVDSVKPNGRR